MRNSGKPSPTTILGYANTSTADIASVIAIATAS